MSRRAVSRSAGTISVVVLVLAVLSGLFAVLDRPAQVTPPAAGGRDHWVNTWVSMPQLTEPHNLPPAPFTGPDGVLHDSTLRQTVRMSVGGHRMRLRFSNAFGGAALPITAVTVALPVDGQAGVSAVRPGTTRRVSFNGRPSVTVPVGAQMVSDPLDFPLAARANLTVTAYLADGQRSLEVTSHPGSRTTSYLLAGNQVDAADLPGATRTDHWYFLSGVEVLAGDGTAGVVMLGDSLTDGRGSTTNQNNRWPDQLLNRLDRVAVLNQAAGGNRVLNDGLGPNALARLDRDVLAQSGVRWLLVFEGINDIGTAEATEPAQKQLAADLIGAYEQIIVRAHAKGLRVYGATLLPFGGNTGYDDPAGIREESRLVVNEWIRTSGRFDAVVDFDAAVRDPADPRRLSPAADEGDHLHLNPTGYRMLADAVPARLFHTPVHRTSWVGTWASVPTATPATATATLSDETVRQVVHTSIAGEALQLRLTNEFGTTPLHVGEVHVARRAGNSGTDIVGSTDRPVTFGGHRSATVPAGAPLVSDPVRLAVPARADLVVSIYLPESTPVTTLHAFAYQDNVVAAGNVTGDRRVTATSTMAQWFFLSGISVATSERDAGAVVALGDSITNGFETDVNANHRWPDLLANRLRDVGVLNLGVAGNRLLHDPNPPPGSDAENFAAFFGRSALGRFDRDVLAQPGVRHVVVLLGVNDLGHPGTTAPPAETVTAQELIAAHRQLITRAHAAGLSIHGGTILPFKGDTLGFYSPANEAKRQAVNRWIRTSGEYDTVIDFDAALRDRSDPQRLNPTYDSGDHLHPNDAGMAAMAAAVPLHIL